MLGLCKVFIGVLIASTGSATFSSPPAGEALMDSLLEDRASAIRQMYELLNAGAKEEKRLACDFFRLTRTHAAAPEIAGVLNDSDPRVREHAIQALRFIGDKSLLPEMRNAFRQAEASGHGAELRACLAALGERGDIADAALISPCLHDARPSVCVTAACALAALGNSQGTALLLQSVRTGTLSVQRVAVIGLGYLSDSKTGVVLDKIANDPNFPWHAEARLSQIRRQLQFVKDPKARQSIWLGLVNDPDPDTAKCAVLAMAEEPDLTLKETLTGIAQSSGPAARAAAQLLRWRMGQEIFVPRSEKAFTKFQGSTHQSFFEAAYSVLEQNQFNDVFFYQGDAYTEVHDAVLEEDLQDCGNNACSLGDLCQSANRHFFNAHTGAGLPHIPIYACDPGIQNTAVQSAIEHWNKAEAAFAENSLLGYNAGYHLLGQVLHLLQDMSVPAHSHVDNHLDSAGDDFELWLEEMEQNGLSMPAEGLEPVLPENPSIENFLQNMADYSYALAAHDAILVDDPDEQEDWLDHDLGRMFKLAYHDGWFEDTRWTLKDRNNKLVGEYDPNPLFDLGDDEWWPADGNFTTYMQDGNEFTAGKVYVENLRDGSTCFQPCNFDNNRLKNTEFTVGDSLLDIYARELLPECIRYSAGLLHYFAETFTAEGESEGVLEGEGGMEGEIGEGEEEGFATEGEPEEGEGGIEGEFEGFSQEGEGEEGEAEGQAEGMPEGSAEGGSEGGEEEGEAEGQPEGSAEGGSEGGEEEGEAEGQAEGMPEGSAEGGSEGGEEEGEAEGQAEGMPEGSAEGGSEGGEAEGQAEGMPEGSAEGGSEGGEGELEGMPLEGEGVFEGEELEIIHAADQDGDFHISVSELLRVIQFYNSGALHCQPGSEDGYAPGSGTETCPPHDSDFNTQDWRINVTELLRMIQFYNSGGYFWCPEKSTEDGFCPL